MKLSILSSVALLGLGASAQSTKAYTDTNTGITFQGYWAAVGYSFGLALSDDASSTDFIGQITATGSGWAGASFTGSMANALLVVAYPDGDNVVASLREASTYTNPDVLEGTDATLMPIPEGTYVNETGFSYTFLCKNCILDDGRTFTMASEVPIIAWVLSKNAVDEPSEADSLLNYHDSFGIFGLDGTSAKSADFATWAAMAVEATSPTTPVVPGNSTIPITNGTTPIATPVSNQTYDYIVAGGGPAGIIAAERIAEAGHSVLLLERGPASTFASGGDVVMPWNDTVTAFDVPGVSWYLSKISGAGGKWCSDTAGQAGCVLGGGSAVNCVLFMRPPQRDFDDKWPAGWQWADVSAAADRLYERNPGEILPSADDKYYDQSAYDILSRHFTSAGWSEVNALEDPDSKHQIFSHTPYNTQNGLRAGPVKTYLPLAQALPNFTLQLNAKVMRVVRTGSTVSGVEIEVDGARQIINVNEGGRVILASGALSTPRILFNSGIGPEEQIKIAESSGDVTLPAESDWIPLPVGEHTQDHSVWQLQWDIIGNQNLTSLSQAEFLNPTTEMTELFAKGTGPLVQGNPRLDLWTSITNDDGSVRYVQCSLWSDTNSTVNMVVYLTHGSDSSGVLGITDAGATEFTTTPWLTTEGDREAVEKFMNQMLEYSRLPGAQIQWPVANATGKDLMADPASAGTHYVGSARMGVNSGLEGGIDIVDLNAKVYGTDNLFIVDASIHPDLPTGNTQAIVMVVAEAAAEKILALAADAGSDSGSGSSPATSSAVPVPTATSSVVPAPTATQKPGSCKAKRSKTSKKLNKKRKMYPREESR